MQHFALLSAYWIHLLLLPTVCAVDVTVETTENCACPTNSYTCRADFSSEIEWDSIDLIFPISYNIHHNSKQNFKVQDGLRVVFSEVPVDSSRANLTAELIVTDLARWNGSVITCQAIGGGFIGRKDVSLCLIGPASAPRDLSVEWKPPYAVISFQSPVYGGECVEYYMVTAVSEDRYFTCNSSTKFKHKCSVYIDGDPSVYNYTVYGITSYYNGVSIGGSFSSSCSLQFPENITAHQKMCEVLIKWEGRHKNTTISWTSGSGPTHYERADFESYHLLTLDYSEIGPVELAVTFSSPVCNRTSVYNYLVQMILKSVSLKFPILVIESRDCIASPENYRIVVTSTDSTQLVNVSFNTTIEQDVGDVVRPNTQYTIRVQLVHISSNTIVDEMNETLLWIEKSSTGNLTPLTMSTPINFSNLECEDHQVNVLIISLCLIGGTIVGNMSGAIMTLAVVLLCKRKKRSFISFSKNIPRDVSSPIAGTPKEDAVYETVDARGNTGLVSTSENVAYAASTTPSTTPNPAYESVNKKQTP